MRLSDLRGEGAPKPAPALAGVAPGGGNGNGNGSGNGGGNGGGNGNGNGDHLRKQIEELADSDPDKVAQQLRTWMQED